MPADSYHHGDLPAALLQATAAAIADRGVAALSLREVARRAGVSHAAPAHHFGDKAGLLTALAVQGFEAFGDALRGARDEAGDDPARQFTATGHAYVRFAIAHPAHFEVMFQPALHRRDDPALRAASAAAFGQLEQVVDGARGPGAPPERPRGTGSRLPTEQAEAIRAWALAHGLAKLCLEGALPQADSGPWQLDQLLDAVFGSIR